MKLVNFFENSKPGSGFQEPSESGCLGKQIKKGKAKKKSESVDESFQHYTVKHKPSGKTYKVTAMSQASAKTRAAVEHGGRSASKYSGTSDDQFEIVEGIQEQNIDLEEMDMPDLSDDMIGTPDDYYDAEQRKEAYRDLKDATDDCRHDWQKDTVIDGICPECSGSSCMDGDEENGEDSCYGRGNFGCDGGEMTQRDDGLPNWAEIIKHDKRKAERDDAKANYPGDEEVINQIARAVKQMDDPRQMFQYMKVDYPFMGRAQRSDLITKGMKKAGLTSESLNEGEERSIISNACVEKLVDMFLDSEDEFESIDALETNLYNELEKLDVEDCVDPDMEVGGQRIGDFASGKVIDCCSSGAIIDDVMQNLDLTKIGEGRIEDTFGTKTIDKHDKPEKDKKKKDEDIDLIKKLSGIKTEGRPFKNLELADIIKLPNGKEYVFKPEKGMFIGTDTTYPGGPEEVDPTSRAHRELLRLRKNQAARFKGVKEDAEGDASESAVAKMIAKALGDENRWTEMSAAELYAELESTSSEMADMVKDVAKMIYGVSLAESKRDTRCSDKCCGADVKAEDCECSSDCPHCDCNRDYVDNRNLGHPDGVTSDEEDKLHGRIHKIREDEITLEDNQDFHEEFGVLGYSEDEEHTFEAEYQGRKVKLNKPMRGDVKKFKVYVKDPKTGNVKKVNFGHGGTSAKRKTMRIRKSNPKARKSFRARHNCDNPGPKTKARYWSCRKW